MQYTIRPFQKEDLRDVRLISCETAFLGDAQRIFNDDEILADALTAYFTDYEPQSCFVAVSGANVVGYIIGAKDTRIMNKIFYAKIFFSLLIKAFCRGVFFDKINLKFFFYLLRSVLRGEFFCPNFSKNFPAVLHINLRYGARGQGIGASLIKHYLDYLRQNKIAGVHFGTFSDRAGDFFLAMGFDVLSKGKRTYLKPYVRREVNFYLFGMKL
ncbi:MAG: GNAT family N-acetyltransferase [Candidatus Omnitrophota bacterium]|nr:GNAT family N-acetyltransferase [Candidatus Omnitrophota bacterium]